MFWTLVVGQHWSNFQNVNWTYKYIYFYASSDQNYLNISCWSTLIYFSIWFVWNMQINLLFVWFLIRVIQMIWLYNLGTKNSNLGREVCCRLIIWLYNLGTKSSDLGREVCCRLYLVCGCYTQLNQNIRRLCQWRGL